VEKKTLPTRLSVSFFYSPGRPTDAHFSDPQNCSARIERRLDIATVTKPERLASELSLDDLILPANIERVVTFELMRSAREEQLPRHMLALTGAGGLGKTSLGLAIAKEVGCTGVIIVPSKPVRAEVDWIMANLDDGMMLLLDELHSYANQTWLLDTLEGARGIGRSIEFFAFGATTNRGALPQTVFSRFPVRLDISYSDEELARIADQVASRFGITLDNHGREVLLRAAVGNPRTMRNILGFWDAGPEQAVEMAQLTRDGLDESALRMLEYMAEHARPIGRATLARVLEAPGGLADVEAVLIRRRYIKPTPSGLVIEHAGAKRVRIRNEKGI
jgi:Holliday junction resolvasome RuvABC ATP-dependent DNA helicase subunit